MRSALVLGSGGREAALVRALTKRGVFVYAAPGNAGIASDATCVPILPNDFRALMRFAQERKIDCTIVGPEAPLVGGVVDHFRAEQLKILGPTRDGARAEGSKAWFKEFLRRHRIPAPASRTFAGLESAMGHVRRVGAEAIVLKMDGLMGGKGVFLPASNQEAIELLPAMFEKGPVVIEERVTGVERSVIALMDGKDYVLLPFTEDYKRLYDGDRGPNTGGMGAHTLTLDPVLEAKLRSLVEAVYLGLRQEGIAYSGFMYLGVMVTRYGPQILEMNCRGGDPETQVILESLDVDFAELAQAVVEGRLGALPQPKKVREAALVVLASKDYPEPSPNDDVITGFREAEASGAIILHAGTKSRVGEITTGKSGRVLNSLGVGATLREARAIAYQGAELIQYPGKHYRTDIGAK